MIFRWLNACHIYANLTVWAANCLNWYEHQAEGEVIRLGDSGGDGKIGPTSSTPTLVPHPREPLGKPPFVCVRPCACDLPAQTQLHPNVFTLWQEHIAKLFTSHPAIRYAAYAQGGVQGRVTRQQRNPLAMARLHTRPFFFLLCLHFAGC